MAHRPFSIAIAHSLNLRIEERDHDPAGRSHRSGILTAVR
jgi:hypothetical protein